MSINYGPGPMEKHDSEFKALRSKMQKNPMAVLGRSHLSLSCSLKHTHTV